MERRRSSSKRSIDELALVKAAAWAWYEHGSGSEGRVMREYDLEKSKRAPKPSRYKIEAMKEYEETPPPLKPKDDHELLSPLQSASVSPLSTISSKQSEISLLDDYEIERISKELDYYIESSQAEYFRSLIGSAHHKKVVSFSESGTSERKSKQKNKISRRFWFKDAAVCGSRQDDVVDGRSFNVARIHDGRNGTRQRSKLLAD
ncbi:hypothetical protein ACH5RR_012101 [Cinchona calisaya]|uniref:Uncharacterized protein n=1 Tax=Cinchona calisaya TaxID=153742 RepID=A0ABD3AAE7_9GENT